MTRMQCDFFFLGGLVYNTFHKLAVTMQTLHCDTFFILGFLALAVVCCVHNANPSYAYTVRNTACSARKAITKTDGEPVSARSVTTRSELKELKEPTAPSKSVVQAIHNEKTKVLSDPEMQNGLSSKIRGVSFGLNEHLFRSGNASQSRTTEELEQVTAFGLPDVAC